MRFIAKSQQYTIIVEGGIIEDTVIGRERVIVPMVAASWSQSDHENPLKVWEQKVALRHWSGSAQPSDVELGVVDFSEHFHGMPSKDDQIIGQTYAQGIVSPVHRLSLYDTDAVDWTQYQVGEWRPGGSEAKTPDQIKEMVEQFLLNNPAHGADYIMVEPEKLPPPWPKYDELQVTDDITIDDIIERVIQSLDEFGFDAREVLDYEHANANREELVNTLNLYIEAREPVAIAP